ncbi:MAG: gamma-glutamylcyclotransferase [Candidatus Phaeomarinobacter sp.]
MVNRLLLAVLPAGFEKSLTTIEPSGRTQICPIRAAALGFGAMRHRTPPIGPDGLWIFGYGSLMWEPGFAYVRAERAVLPGWHRRMSMLATKSYGWPTRPGLAAGLHPGGTVDGVAFLVAPDICADILPVLAQREWAYLSIMAPVRLGDGTGVRALTYLANPVNGRFRLTQARGDFLRRLNHGIGRKGRAADYVRRSAEALSAHGVRASDLHELVPRIDGTRGNRRRLSSRPSGRLN